MNEVVVRVDPILTAKQLRVLEAMADGKTERTGAELLGIATDTWKTHTTRIHARLNAHTNAEAVAKGYRLGLLKAERNGGHDEQS